ncbi:MAG TPA: contractile injection system tape measure protein, partial [Nitrosomonas sp.]|nr:contractile injection system tape measure protein [Nitrosomonas sp.]
QQVFLTDLQIQQITAALANDFKMQWQHLTAAFYSGKLMPGRLSEITLKNLTLAVLEHDPASVETDRLTWIKAVKTHARKAVDSAFYYQQILEKRLLDQAVDLEIIAAGSTGRDRLIQTETATEEAVRQPAEVVAIIYQRIQSALRQAAITGTDLYFEEVNAAAVDAQTVRKRLLEMLQDVAIRKQLIDRLPESVLIDIAYLLSPQVAIILEQLLQHAELFYRHAVNLHYASAAEWKRALWDSSLKILIKAAGTDSSMQPLDTVFFIRALITDMSNSHDDFPVIQSWHHVLTRIQNQASLKGRRQEGGRASVLQHLLQTCVMQRNANTYEKSEKSLYSQFDAMIARELAEVDSADTSDEVFYIQNAGQVLASPYLPRLFGLLELIEAGTFTNRQVAERAVHLLQFMVSEETHSPEYRLLLNKILCGLPAGIPVCNQIELSHRERDTIEDLMRGMIRNWKTIGKTSIEGLRETFLQRQGQLQLKDGIWFLTIEPGPFDVLLDQLPWSFSVIKHSWMERAVHVTWR